MPNLNDIFSARFHDILLSFANGDIAYLILFMVCFFIILITLISFSAGKIHSFGMKIISQFRKISGHRSANALANEFVKLIRDMLVSIISLMRILRNIFAIHKYPTFFIRFSCFCAAIDNNTLEKCKPKVKMILPSVGILLMLAMPVVFTTYHMAITNTTPNTFRDKIIIDFLNKSQNQEMKSAISSLSDGFTFGIALILSFVYVSNILLIDRAFVSANLKFRISKKLLLLNNSLKLIFRIFIVSLTALLASTSLELSMNEIPILKKYIEESSKKYDTELLKIITDTNAIPKTIETIDNLICNAQLKNYDTANKNLTSSFKYQRELRGPLTIDAEKNIKDKQSELNDCRKNNQDNYKMIDELRENYAIRQTEIIKEKKKLEKLGKYLSGEINLNDFKDNERTLPKITTPDKKRLLSEIKKDNIAFNAFSIIIMIIFALLEIFPLILKWIASESFREYDKKYKTLYP